ncbi:hypothetical protein [Rhodocaloribacter sp.]
MMRKTTFVASWAVAVLVALSSSGCTTADTSSEDPPGASYLFVWAGDEDGADSDFLAVVDARRSEPTYGQVLATLPVGAVGTVPHHTEYEYPSGDTLFANGWAAGQTFVIDLQDPLAPRMIRSFEAVEGYRYPHSYVRLPDGHVLATFQSHGDRYAPPGGLVEMDGLGRGVRAASAATTEIDSALTWPYSLAVLPGINRVVSTSSDMGMPPWSEWEYHWTNHVQVWALDELQLPASVPLPAVEGAEYHFAPSEPRVLADGSVYVVTFACGLFRMEGLETDRPSATFVHAFPGSLAPGEECGVPVVYGDYWIQTAPGLPGLIALDVSNPEAPVEASRLVLDARYPRPHWIAADRTSGRLVVTGMDASWVLVVAIDSETGALSIDEAFRDGEEGLPGIDFDRATWPHGATGGAVVHGALFGQ